jgi:hypothetical protein
LPVTEPEKGNLCLQKDAAQGPAAPCAGEGGETNSAWAVLHELQTAEGRVIYGFGLNYRPTDPDYLSRNLYN